MRKSTENQAAIIEDRATELLNWAFDDYEGHSSQQINHMVDQVLAAHVFPHSDEPEIAFNQLRDRGMYALFETNDQAERFAKLCVASSAGAAVDDEEIEHWLAWSARYEAQLGISLVERFGRRVLTAI